MDKCLLPYLPVFEGAKLLYERACTLLTHSQALTSSKSGSQSVSQSVIGITFFDTEFNLIFFFFLKVACYIEQLLFCHIIGFISIFIFYLSLYFSITSLL